MSTYKKIILSLSLLTLVMPIQNRCEDQVHTCGGSIHKKGIGIAILGGITWLTWKLSTETIEQPLPINKDIYCRTILGPTLAGVFIVGTALSLLCCSGNEYNCDGPKTSLWMILGGFFGFLYGNSQYSSTPQYMFLQATELYEDTSYHELIRRLEEYQDPWEKESDPEYRFLRKARAWRYRAEYPSLSAYNGCQEIARELRRSIEYLDKCLDVCAVEDETLVKTLREKASNRISLTQHGMRLIEKTFQYKRELRSKRGEKEELQMMVDLKTY